jgi:hypothetical protein
MKIEWKDAVKYIVIVAALLAIGCVVYGWNFKTVETTISNALDKSCSKCESDKHTVDDCPMFDPTIDYSPYNKACKEKQRKFFKTEKYRGTPEFTFADQSDEETFFEELESHPRNPMRNPKAHGRTERNRCSMFRDVDDGMLDIHKPIGAIDCADGATTPGAEQIGKYINTGRNYDESDAVERINDYRRADARDLAGKPIMQIYDELAGNKCYIKPMKDSLKEREGHYTTEGNKTNKTFKRDNWAYEKESSLNGGTLGGSLYPSDPEASDYTMY